MKSGGRERAIDTEWKNVTCMMMIRNGLGVDRLMYAILYMRCYKHNFLTIYIYFT